MGFWNKFSWTNFQQLNLDWFLQEWEKFKNIMASKEYVDEKDAETLEEAKAYTDSKALDTLTNANSYTDGKFTEATNYTDSRIAGIRAYTDSELDDLKDYVNAQDAATLQAAKDYTDAHSGGSGSVVTKEIIYNMMPYLVDEYSINGYVVGKRIRFAKTIHEPITSTSGNLYRSNTLSEILPPEFKLDVAVFDALHASIAPFKNGYPVWGCVNQLTQDANHQLTLEYELVSGGSRNSTDYYTTFEIEIGNLV